MKEVKVSIHNTEIKSLNYQNGMKVKPGEPLRLQFKNGSAVKLNPQTPTMAVVAIKVEVLDETQNFKFEAETLTAVSSESFIANFDTVIKENYMSHIMIGVHEKIRGAAAAVGFPIPFPKIDFTYADGNESIDTEIFRNM